MTELPLMTDEFRSWITDGLEDGERWMVVMYDFDDNLDYPVYFATQDEVNAWREKCGENVIYVFELSGTEDEIVLRIRQLWAAEQAESEHRAHEEFRLSAE